jgi:hypothetical protein
VNIKNLTEAEVQAEAALEVANDRYWAAVALSEDFEHERTPETSKAAYATTADWQAAFGIAIDAIGDTWAAGEAAHNALFRAQAAAKKE